MSEQDQNDDLYDIAVLEMLAEKLTIEIKPKEKGEESDEMIESNPTSPSSIEVIHRHPTPPLHSILKQRTVSESSEDHSLAASSNSIVSLDDDLPTEHASSGKRRTVSFNSHIDRASFKSNASVSSMAPALKSKRKRQRRKEEKLRKAERRKRKLSGGEGTSSGEDNHLRESFSDSHSVSEEEEGEEKEKLFQRSVSDPGPNMEETADDVEESSTVAQLCTKAGEIEVIGGDNSDSAKISVGSDFRTNECNDSGEGNVSENGKEEKSSVTWNMKVTKEIQSKLAAGKVEVNGSKKDVEDSDDDEFVDANEGQGSVKVTDESVASVSKGKTDVGSSSERKDEQVREKSEVETMLSWEDGPQMNGTEHATKCAFEFSNTVMFDLDVD